MSQTTKTFSRRGPIDTTAVQQLQRGHRVERARRARGAHSTSTAPRVHPDGRDRALTRFLELTRDS